MAAILNLPDRSSLRLRLRMPRNGEYVPTSVMRHPTGICTSSACLQRPGCSGADGKPLPFRDYFEHHTGITWPHAYAEEFDEPINRVLNVGADFQDCLAATLAKHH